MFLAAYSAHVNAQVGLGIGDGKADEAISIDASSAKFFAGKSGSGANCRDGSADIYPCLGVSLRSIMTVADLGGAPGIRLNDLWGWHDIEKGRYYILVGRQDGTAFVDVTDADSPVYLGELLKTPGSPSSAWRDIKVLGHYALIVADGALIKGALPHGMQIFDLHDLRNPGVLPSLFVEAAHYSQIASSHNIVVDEESRFAYAVGSRSGGISCKGGLHMIDMADPLHPSFAACFSDSRSTRGYTHDAQCTVYHGPDTEHFGKQICFGSNESALGIVDVTDKQRPVPLGVGEYPTSRYVHQGWLTEDHAYFFQDDEADERSFGAPTRTLIWDVKDLDDPVLVKEFLAPVSTIDHNLYVSGHFVYQANYTSGLRILDISNVMDPKLVKYFDTYPSDDKATFNGAWSVFPFFSNGMVYVSSRDEGLFLLDPGSTPVTEISMSNMIVDGTNVHFSWTTIAEFKVRGFEIQERIKGGSFVSLAFVTGAGTTADSQSYSYVLSDVSPGRHEYRLQIVSENESRFSEASSEVFVVPGTHVRSEIYPNPISERARLELIVAESQQVCVTIYDMQGRRVAVLHDGVVLEGTQYDVVIGATAIASGKYFLRIVGESFSETLPFVIVR